MNIAQDYSSSVPNKDYAQDNWRKINADWPVDTPPPEIGDAYYSERASRASQFPVSEAERPVVAVIGVGYIDIQLVTAFAAHFDVIAFDVSKRRHTDVVAEVDQCLPVRFTSAAEDIACATHFLIAVPTTLRPDHRLDTSHLRSAIYSVALWARTGATVVVESSVAVGMTRNFLGQMMRVRQLKAGMSPEVRSYHIVSAAMLMTLQRVDSGRLKPALQDILKIISGLDEITPGSLDSIDKLYSKVFRTIIRVSKPEVAEMTKFYENCQRMVGIAYANEMADACVAHGIDAFEVCSAAATKPFGYIPYTPGLGVGGHCIPINPYYLLSNCEFPILQAATENTKGRPRRLGDRVVKSFLYSRRGEEVWNRRLQILVVGVAFKKGQSDTRNSPAVALIQHLLDRWEAEVTFADPLVAQEKLPYVLRLDERTEWNKESLDSFNIIIVTMEQVGLDISSLDNLDEAEVVSYVRVFK
ncbi:UDP-glucose 6-dehydrogenase [Aspergillus sclerotialis]|uniref:UDP-glucose 6-dehydrogenase n=1 Tax=Aspergillus sclerotialis TaxID=2070753 RepID=A0A3A2ZYM9_9EURO|nr:UDP-glucose 6-dehydrogenase [Aspergillus sclerotialis]